MTEYRTPMDVSTIHTALQRMVDEPDPAERRRRAGVVASEIVAAFNRAANQNQVALADTEEVMLTKIDRLHEQVGNSNTLLSGVIEALGALRGAVEVTAVESAARLGKFEERLDQKRAQIDDHERRLAAIERLLAERPTQRAKEHQEILDTIRQAIGNGAG